MAVYQELVLIKMGNLVAPPCRRPLLQSIILLDPCWIHTGLLLDSYWILDHFLGESYIYPLTLEFLIEAAGKKTRSRKPGSTGGRCCFDLGHFLACFWMKFGSDLYEFRCDLHVLGYISAGEAFRRAPCWLPGGSRSL